MSRSLGFHCTKVIVWLYIAGYALLHVKVVKFIGTDITFPWFVVMLHFLLLAPIIKLRGADIKLLIFFLVLPLLSVLFASDLYSSHFVVSYSLVASMVLYLILVKNHAVNIGKVMYEHRKVFYYLFIITSLFTVLQSVFLNAYNDFSLLSPFGDYGRSGPGGNLYSPHPNAPIKKANGLLSEPSAAGWYHAVALAVSISFASFKKGKLALCAIGASSLAMLATFSFSGMVNVAVLFLLILINTRKAGRIMAILCLFFALTILMLYGNGLVAFIEFRLDKIFDPGNSLYYRVVAPFYLFADSLVQYPFGIPLGNDSYMAGQAYMVNAEDSSESNLDNGFFFIIYHWGWFGVLFSLLVVALSAIQVFKKKISGYIATVIVLLLLEVGSLPNPATYMIIGMALSVYFFICEKEKERIKI